METSLFQPGWITPHLRRVQAVLDSKSVSLPAAITEAASSRTYHIIGLLVDRSRTQQAYRAYAYFRWVDDQLDQAIDTCEDRMAFIRRQQVLIRRAYAGESSPDVTAQEQMIVDLIRADCPPDSGLAVYIQQLMAVMAFDADRRGRPITARELNEYTHALAVGVTEALHYFIGHDDPPPPSDLRYLAVTAAHITHMLRDTCEDLEAGYYNIPSEYLAAHDMGPGDIDSEPYRLWVRCRVQLARDYFKAGRSYLAQVPNLRCRMAGYAYCAQFERALDAIEQQAFGLPVGEQKERI